MLVKLLAKHVIGDREWPAETVMELSPGVEPTPLMQGLDEEATITITAVKRRVFGRRKDRLGNLVDDPPIERPLDNPVVPPLPQGGPPR